MPVFSRVFFTLTCAFLTGSAAATTQTPTVPDAQQAFAAEQAREFGLDEKTVLATLAKAQYQQSIIDAMTRPAEAKPWKAYRPIFITDARIRSGIEFYRANRELIERISTQFHVAPEIIVAIIGIETSYGKNIGKYRVLDALATLSFHYPPREKFFRGELSQLLRLDADRLAYPVEELKGSYAGAMGWGQFMPTSIAKYAQDYDGDGRIDLWNSVPDILASVANYFQSFGWEDAGIVAVRVEPAAGAREITPANSEPVYPLEQLSAWGYATTLDLDPQRPATLLKLEAEAGTEYWVTFKNFHVITRYNKSPLYAMAVMQLAESIAAGVSEPVP
ncbi:lytic murein transglycosylase B [Tahibacter amnicola]|uniref:Lytic murein transglycosylase B n=1 Tax=Tahibacter amnicola TaxID=2976241 RepID=A0ABY6BD78_9GAMM|nr:lytic murein transglycosylase B [Tahibacter amnicola]UXI67999.1 lytic murein transglycosylase B [Tahibacter amnicola]